MGLERRQPRAADLLAYALAAVCATPSAARGEGDAGPSLAARGRLVPAGWSITEIDTRVRDPERDALPADVAQAEEVLRGYHLFLDTRSLAPGSVGNALSCGNCHLNAGQKEGALPAGGHRRYFS